MSSVKSSHATGGGCQPDGGANPEIELLDQVKKGFALSSDAALATLLGIDRTSIYAVRAGKGRLGVIQRLKVLDRISFLKTRRLVESLLPENLAKEVVRWSQAAAGRYTDTKLRKAGQRSEDERLLEVVKVAFDFESDKELAEFLGIQRSAISMVRSGKSGLGVLPKLRILSRVAPDVPYGDIEKALTSTEHLISLL